MHLYEAVAPALRIFRAIFAAPSKLILKRVKSHAIAVLV